MTRSSPSRQGFTLVELLVATAVFVFGFTAAFGMFLAALRYRTLADDTIKLSLASASIPEEMAIGKLPTNTTVPVVPLKPSDYAGDGLPTETRPAPITGDLLPFAQVPGTWYLVESCTDVAGNNENEYSATLHAQIVVVAFSQGLGSPTLPLEDVWNRLRPRPNDLPSLTTPVKPRLNAGELNPTDHAMERAAFLDMLVRRGLAVRQQVVVLRRPAWMT